MSDKSDVGNIIKRFLATGLYVSLGYLACYAVNETPLKFKYALFAYNLIFISCGHGIYKMVFNPKSNWDVFGFVMDNTIMGLIAIDITYEACMPFSWTMTEIVCTVVPFLTYMINSEIEPGIAQVFFPISFLSLLYISYDTNNHIVAYLALSELLSVKLFPYLVGFLTKDCVTIEFFKLFGKHITIMLATMLLRPYNCCLIEGCDSIC